MAVVIALFAGAIVAGSLQLDTGWAPETGPQSGYLPLRLGIALAAVSLLIFLQAMRRPAQGGFVTGAQLRLTLAVFIPTVLLVLAMPWLGCYAPTWVYLVYMVRVQGRTPIWKALAVSTALIIAFYAVFELWFRVDLAKGPVEAWLGL